MGRRRKELQRVKTQYDADFVRGVERIGDLAESLIDWLRVKCFAKRGRYKNSLKLVREATAEDLKAAANRWLAGRRLHSGSASLPSYR